MFGVLLFQFAQAHERVAAGDELHQLRPAIFRQRLGRRREHGPDPRQHGRVDLIGLGELAATARQFAHALRVEHDHRHLRLLEEGDDAALVPAARFAHDVDAACGGMEAPEQPPPARGSVGEFKGAAAQADREGELGHIEAEMDGRVSHGLVLRGWS